MRTFEELKQSTKDHYSMKPDAPILLEEFGYYSLDTWIGQGYIKKETDLGELFGFERLVKYYMKGLAGCSAPFSPAFENVIIETTDEYDIVRDGAGRTVKYFKGRRDGFMPQYLDFPVKDLNTWNGLAWRLDCNTKERNEALLNGIKDAVGHSASGYHLIQYIVGAYMYLRSLIGGEQLLYAFYDDPKLIHTCMKKWLELSEYVTGKYQEQVRIDEVLFDEDICYNHGSLISPSMIREFLFPYYKELVSDIRRRNAKFTDKGYELIIHVATDGDCRPVIGIYKEIGMNYMSPMEVASGCDVVAIRKAYPDLRIKGGIDKRILAGSKEAIKREIDRIMPFMKEKGGYLPTCDHGVPPEVPFLNYVYFRELLKDYAK